MCVCVFVCVPRKDKSALTCSYADVYHQSVMLNMCLKQDGQVVKALNVRFNVCPSPTPVRLLFTLHSCFCVNHDGM